MKYLIKLMNGLDLVILMTRKKIRNSTTAVTSKVSQRFMN